MMEKFQGIGMTSRRTRNRMIARLEDQGITNQDVLEVMRNTPRHIFVDEALASRSYEDTPLPIGYNQTISQPYIVARMTELLLEKGDVSKVLEIGTGCGYQTAILAQLVEQVYSIERIGALQKKAKNYLSSLNLSNIHYQHSDGNFGWQEYAPFDGILVSAAAETIPKPLLEQLDDKGIMLIPEGRQREVQSLQKVTRRQDHYQSESLESVVFVPFLSGVE
ncbi:MAG: protein-L-isoaspartate(D-aspartate) O-methyltransferase [Methylococcaceae bacterium]|nr:protein-L-isoaspartate(D-aspartate) O-methyltransferase [Methylococcaceae bacterium]